MFENFMDFLNSALGLNTQNLTILNVILRTFIVYTVTILLIRIGKKRFLAKPSSFDLVLILILGSVISRAITTNVPFFQTILAAFILVVLHTFFSILTFYSAQAGAFIKGRPMVLVKDGKIQWAELKKSHITERDLLSAIRRNGQVLDPDLVKIAILERNGEISVIKKDPKAQILEIKVEDGVQIIKIEIKP